MRHTAIQRELDRLDPKVDHQRIVYLITLQEFPFDTVRALDLAFFRTFATPKIAAILDQSGEIGRRTQKRYDDTDLILSEILEAGYDSRRGRAALRRLNQLHHRFPIGNDEFLYVLSAMVLEPIRWIDRFGWRPLTPTERLGLFYYWRAVGQRMGIHSIPERLEELERYNVAYERAQFQSTESARRIGEAMRDLFLGWLVPRHLQPLARPFLYALLDDPLLDAMGFPHPSPRLRRLVEGALRARARLVRLLPPRQQPRLRTTLRRRSYPKGYRIEELGPRR
jgi:hypothetical protein